MERSEYFKYAGENTRYVVFPLGGIGTGCIGLGGDGRLRDWEIFNRPSKGSVNGFSHFAVRAEQDGKVLDTRILAGPFYGQRAGYPLDQFGFGVHREHMTGFPSFDECVFSGPFPVATLDFSDSRFPATVQLTAFSPFIPMESRLSSLPTAMFEFAVTNTTQSSIDYTVFGCQGFVFQDTVQVSVEQVSGRTAILGCSSSEASSPNYSEICIATDCDETSYQRNFYRGEWFDELEVYWQDITAGGPLKDRYYDTPGGTTEHSTLACHFAVAPGATRVVRVAISWFVPNFVKYWSSEADPPVWKNYYATQWESAVAVSNLVFSHWNDLAQATKQFQATLLDMTLPDPVLDAISANLSILKTATVLRLDDGTFYGWEGCGASSGSCEGSCTHVWNYQQALPFLFPDLERSMRVADFKYNQHPDTGGMAYRLTLPLGSGISSDRPCCDGQFGDILKTYRDWKLTGDDNWLKSLWPYVKAAVGYAWHPGNYDKWDPQKSGVLTGRQHHTLDMELFGANSWLNGFYLGALLAASKMATVVGEPDTANEFLEIYQRGRSWTHDNLYNGSYFFQKIDLSDKGQLAPYDGGDGSEGSIYDEYWSDEFDQVKYQIGQGCEIDQVVAQWHANLYGLGDIFDPDKFATAVRSIRANNFHSRLGDVPNPCRIFGLEQDAGTLICTWPTGSERPAIPVPYNQESMHGFEYAFGGQLMMIGEVDEGIEVFTAVRNRYRGHNRNPWNEIECGSNYARSMASYAAILVLSGYGFDMTVGRIDFAPKIQSAGEFRSIWSTGTAWGKVTIRSGYCSISVVGGSLKLATISVSGATYDVKEWADPSYPRIGDRVLLAAGDSVTITDSGIVVTAHDIA